MRQRLKENKLPLGIAALLYGQPGTGKTESVMQMVRATGRAIMHVDISEVKTCWFGKSPPPPHGAWASDTLSPL